MWGLAFGIKQRHAHNLIEEFTSLVVPVLVVRDQRTHRTTSANRSVAGGIALLPDGTKTLDETETPDGNGQTQ